MRFDMLIDGRMHPGASVLAVIDPSTGAVFEHCARASPADLDCAVAAALAAFPPWRRVTWAARQAVLAQIADVIEAQALPLARLLTQEQGKPLQDATTEIIGAAYIFRYYATLAMPVKVLQDDDTRRVELHREPLGVVGAIVPWNFPIFMAAMKIAPSLLTGNTVVLKPAPTTPLSTLLLGALVKDIIPPGVLNIIADDNDLGGAITAHPDIRKISFTGSTQTGMKVMAAAAATLKRVTLELGGNDAAIVLDDCDPHRVAPKLFQAGFANGGQLCVALKRLFVPESLYDPICDELARLAKAAVVSPGLMQGSQIGPVQNRAQYEKLKALIETARMDGTIVAGGDYPAGDGYFINPTIVRDIRPGTQLVDEEQFGPVLPVISYDTLDDAVRSANASSFGLGNSVWSPDTDRAAAVAAQLDSGTVWINQHGVADPAIPFAGAKMSGIGAEFAEEGLFELTQVKIINLAKAAL